MQKGHKGGKPKTPVYLGLFAIDSKDTTKCIRTACKDAIHCVLKRQRPQAYLEQAQQTINKEKKYELETNPTQEEIVLVEKDYSNYDNFNCPGDNYHCTTLYIGHKLQKLNKKQKALFQNWKSGQKLTINIDFIVYVPNHIVAGFVSNTQGVEVDNEFPHITLLLKGKASAVESNSVLQLLNKHCPEIFKERHQKVTILNIPYGNVSRVIYVIDQKIEINTVSGDNFQLGKK